MITQLTDAILAEHSDDELRAFIEDYFGEVETCLPKEEPR